MKHMTTRSLATTAISGALVFGTAGLAHADTDRVSDSESRSNTTTELRAPIEFGGVTFDSSSSSSAEQDSTVADGDESVTSSSSESSERAQHLHFGAFSLDPSFLFEAAEAQREAERVTDDGDDVSTITERESASNVDAQAPVRIGGAEGQVESHDTSSEESTVRDGDESSSQSESTERHSQQGFDIEDTLIDPLLGTSNGSSDTERESILDLN